MTSVVDSVGQQQAAVPPGRRVSMMPPVVFGALAAAGTAGLAVWNPHTHHVPLCPFHAMTGWSCPLCGGLRAVHDLTAHQWTSALTDNVLVVGLLPLIVLWWALWLVRALGGRPGTAKLVVGAVPRRWIWWTAVVLLVAYTVVRNLPFGAFLAPAG